MIADRDQVDAYLGHLTQFGIKLGLDTVRALLAAVDAPQDRFPVVHVAGSNGKGSTVAMLDRLFCAYGLTVGRYTSPHLQDFSERICVNGQPIADVDLVRHTDTLAKVAASFDPPPTFFEAGTALALMQFANPGKSLPPVDVALMEVGLGGRLDATNVLTPRVCIITNVTLEHTDHLGATIEQVATEKAGIIKAGIPVVTAATGLALSVIRRRAEQVGAPLYMLGQDFAITQGERFSYQGIRTNYNGLKLGLAGDHQRSNAALALAALELYFPLGVAMAAHQVAATLAEANWPGRLEIAHHDPPVVLDCAHNPAGAEALGQYLKSTPHTGPLWLVLGVLADKNFSELLVPLAPHAAHLLLTAPHSERADDPQTQAQTATKLHRDVQVVRGVGAALAQAMAAAKAAGGWVCLAGSVYTVGEARTYLSEYFEHPAELPKHPSEHPSGAQAHSC